MNGFSSDEDNMTKIDEEEDEFDGSGDDGDDYVGKNLDDSVEKKIEHDKKKKVNEKKLSKISKRMSRKEVENKTDVLIGDLAKSIKARRLTPKPEKDSDIVFTDALALELRKFPEQLKCMAKNEISQCLFKYQI